MIVHFFFNVIPIFNFCAGRLALRLDQPLPVEGRLQQLGREEQRGPIKKKTTSPGIIKMGIKSKQGVHQETQSVLLCLSFNRL